MRSCFRTALLPVTIALAMTFLFWWPLYAGAGFIGGDLYSYFFPQKAFYADCLKAGTFPLWNDLTGFGYPVLGESQTGAAYPFHLVFYRCLDLNTAYNAEHLLHYLICFVATWLFAKRLGLPDAGAYLTAIVFTYGWFPPRACLEWAILTGAWLPVALWCVESFLQTRCWKYAIGLSVAIGLQLLAGHFHLAFMTGILVLTYAGWRLWNETSRPTLSGVTQSTLNRNKRVALGLLLGLSAGACLAAVQLLPSWELKQRSSRVVESTDYDPAYGNTPPLYISQLFAPWCWYSPLVIDEDNFVRAFAECVAPWHWFGPVRDPDNPDQAYDLDHAIQTSRFNPTSVGTNKVEAHLYCGLLPFCLACWAVLIWFKKRTVPNNVTSSDSILRQTTLYWLIVGTLAVIYATGMLVPIGRHIPGFSFFRGPGRYGIVTTLAIALLAGQMLGRIIDRISTPSIRLLVLSFVFCSTGGDLWLVSRMVKYTVMTTPPRIAFREQSEIRRRLLAETTPPRLLAPVPNGANLLGVSCVPWYLGIAPSEYVDPQFAMPPVPKPLANNPTPCTPELLAWLSRSGVTHVLNFDPLNEQSWQAELVWKGTDQLLNRIWGRSEPIYLYRFRSAGSAGEDINFPGRTYMLGGINRAIPKNWQDVSANTRRYALSLEQTISPDLVITELAYPGWSARQGTTRLATRKVGLFRGAELSNGHEEIVWTYSPLSVYYGAAISLFTLMIIALVGHLRFWHPQILDRALQQLFPTNTLNVADDVSRTEPTKPKR